MYNKVILVGTITNHIITKQLNPNLQMATLQLTTERTYPKQGEPFTETTIIDIDLWGKHIEIASKFDLGSTILVEGRLRCVRRPNLNTGKESVFLTVTAEQLTNISEQEEAVPRAHVNQELDRFKQNSIDLPDELPF